MVFLISTQFFDNKMDHFDFSLTLIFIADSYFATRDRLPLFPGCYERGGSRPSSLPVYAKGGDVPPLLDRAYNMASAPRVLIGRDLGF